MQIAPKGYRQSGVVSGVPVINHVHAPQPLVGVQHGRAKSHLYVGALRYSNALKVEDLTMLRE